MKRVEVGSVNHLPILSKVHTHVEQDLGVAGCQGGITTTERG